MRNAFLWAILGFVTTIMLTRSSNPDWKKAKNAEKYLPLLHNAEMKYGIPRDLLARVAYQESHFRNDIVSGHVTSAAGALGLMQIVPRWHPTVDPLNVPAAIDYAARYLRGLYQQFGLWSTALAAYNYGPGNVAKVPRADWPAETRNYVEQITGDLIQAYPSQRNLYA